VVTMCRFLIGLLARRSALAILVFVGAMGCVSAESQAGVILLGIQDDAVREVEPNCAAEAGTASGDSADDFQENREPAKSLPGLKAIQGLANTGGCQTPTNSMSGPTGAVAFAAIDAAVSPPEKRGFEYLRECLLTLPQPPPGELLDPPRMS
jgi:hypothetical protein